MCISVGDKKEPYTAGGSFPFLKEIVMEREEAIETVRRCCPRISDSECDFETAMRVLVPELAESEEERIRKEILECIETLIKQPGASPRLCDWIAWLEKQKEQKPIKKDHITPNEEFFQWIYDRLVFVHKENPNVDYMRSLKERIEEIGKEQKPWRVGANAYFTPEQKPYWSEEDVKRLYSIGTQIGFLKGKYSEYQKDIDWLYALAEKMGFHKCKIGEVVTEWKKENIDDKMLSKPKQEWSEEDEKNLELVTDCVYEFYPDPVMKYKLKDWLTQRLKSLRPQPKIEWSEKEYGRLFDIEHYLDGTLQLSPDRKIACIDFLKSLPMRCPKKSDNWRPSEEQMEAFKGYIEEFQAKAEAAVGGWNNFDVMICLYEQLKKL